MVYFVHVGGLNPSKGSSSFSLQKEFSWEPLTCLLCLCLSTSLSHVFMQYLSITVCVFCAVVRMCVFVCVRGSGVTVVS